MKFITQAARPVSAEQYADVHCRETQQLHARACLFGKKPKISSAWRKLITHRTSQSAGFSIGTAMTTAISARTMWQSPTCNCMSQISTTHWSPETNVRLQQNRYADCMRNVLYFLHGLRSPLHYIGKCVVTFFISPNLLTSSPSSCSQVYYNRTIRIMHATCCRRDVLTDIKWVTVWKHNSKQWYISIIQGGREISAIIVTEDYLCYKEA